MRKSRMSEETIKKTRRSEDQMLADSVVNLFDKLNAKLKKIEDERAAIDEIFNILKPLRELEAKFREANDGITGNNNEFTVED